MRDIMQGLDEGAWFTWATSKADAIKALRSKFDTDDLVANHTALSRSRVNSVGTKRYAVRRRVR